MTIKNKQISENNNKFWGISLLVITIFILFSLLSYNANDSSINVADNEKIKNMCGSLGAVISDLLLQICGLSSCLLILCLSIWSLGLLAYGYLSFLWIRIPALMLAICSLSTILCSFSKYNFAMQMLPGGYIGFFLYNTTSKIIGSTMLIIISFLLFILGFYSSVGITNILFIKEKGILRALINFVNTVKKTINTIQYIITLRFIYDAIINRNKIFILIKEMLLVQCSSDKIEEKQPEYFSKTGDSLINFIDTGSTKKNDIKIIEKYTPPSIDLFKISIDNDIRSLTLATIQERTKQLLKVLEEFGVKGSISHYYCGPVVTLFELRPQAGTKASRVVGLSSDIARTMEVLSTRVAIIPGKDAIGIELPNPKRQTVYLRSIFESVAFTNTNADLPITLGKTISGEPVVADLVRMPHLLIAGTTGSGKSVGVSSMILSLIYKMSPDKCKFVMIDPKMLEFSMYEGIPHLLTPVITNPKQAVMALKWVVGEMENRYKLMSNLGVRNISGYNDKVAIAKERGGQIVKEVDVGYDEKTGQAIKDKIFFEAKHMPFIVVIIDEMADLMLVAGKDIESLVQRLAQMARAAGIHLIMATQRPSVDVITGVIKANFPTRISYHVTSKIDSRTILGEQGAEQLLGQGDMLYMASGGKLVRIHGPFVADNEIEAVVNDLKSRYKPEYIDLVVTEGDESGGDVAGFSANKNDSSDFMGGDGDLYAQAVEIVRTDQKTSISYIQRKLRIGYNKAANLIERMETEGILSSPDQTGKRIIV